MTEQLEQPDHKVHKE
jgi:hypothetical protein